MGLSWAEASKVACAKRAAAARTNPAGACVWLVGVGVAWLALDDVVLVCVDVDKTPWTEQEIRATCVAVVYDGRAWGCTGGRTSARAGSEGRLWCVWCVCVGGGGGGGVSAVCVRVGGAESFE